MVTCFVLMLAAVAVNVLCRYIFHYSAFWLSEAVNYLLVYLVLLGAVCAYKRSEHVRVKGPFKKGTNLSAYLKSVTQVTELIFMLCMVEFGADLVEMNLGSYTGVLPVSMGVIYAVVPLAGILMIVHLMTKILCGNRMEEVDGSGDIAD